MTEPRPIISIIIPTHNRRASLQRTLAALRVQTYPLHQIEVVVVVDGCTDGTMDMLRRYQAPFVLRVIEQPGQGQAVARNQGAAEAMGQFLLFLDDDIEPTPSLIEAHVRAHQSQTGQVVIGPYPPIFQGAGFFEVAQQAWWEALFQAMSQPGHRFTYQDLLSGNFSLESTLFARIGGFDPHPIFQAHEDYELGLRLLKAGVTFACAVEAVGHHHDQSNLKRSLLRKRQEGRADAQLARRYPEIIPTLPLAYGGSSALYSSRLLHRLAFNSMPGLDVLITGLYAVLGLFEKMRLRYRWRNLYSKLQSYWYWRGVGEELQTRQAFLDLLEAGKAHLNKPHTSLYLDLSNGLEAAERRLDEKRPMAVNLWYGQHPVGVIPFQPGAEPVRGLHLRPFLAKTLTVPFLEALILAGEISTFATVDRRQLLRSIRAKSPWFGPIEPDKMWFEQYSQWNRLEYGEPEEEHYLQGQWDQFRDLEGESGMA